MADPETLPRKSPFGTRIMLRVLMGSSFAALIALALTSGWGLHAITENRAHGVFMEQSLIDRAHELKIAAEQQAGGVRGYLLTGDPASYRVWLAGGHAFSAALAKLQQLDLKPEDQSLLGEIARLNTRWWELNERVIALKRQGNNKRESAATLLNEAINIQHDGSAKIDRFIANQRAVVSELHEEAARTESNVERLLWALTLLAFPTLAALAGFAGVRIGRPLRELEQAAQQLGEGDMNVRVRPTNDDELGAVATAFNTMAERMGDSVAALRESEDRIRSLFTSIRDTIVVVDPQQRIINANPAFADMFGWRLDDVLNKPVRQLFADDAQYHKIGRLMAEHVGPAPVYETVECRRAGGEVFPCEIGMFWLTDGQGRMTGMAGVIRDVTERMGRERLQQEQIAQLRALDRMKDEFLSVLSHELRTPINGIMGFASILDDGLAGELSADQRRYVCKIQESSDRMLALVNDLIDVSRIQAGKLHLDPRLVDFCEVTRGVIAQHEALAEQRGHVIENLVPCSLPPVFADDQRVAQVLGHLLTNAIKFMPRPGTIRVRAQVQDEDLVCEVQDTGIGVAPGDRERLFQRFAQLDGSYTRSVGGLGLGLYICKAIVEAHGGTIGVKDGEKGQGASFWFSLPLALGANRVAYAGDY